MGNILAKTWRTQIVLYVGMALIRNAGSLLDQEAESMSPSKETQNLFTVLPSKSIYPPAPFE